MNLQFIQKNDRSFVEAAIERETEKAILVTMLIEVGSSGASRKVWFPKSQIELVDEGFTAPNWLLSKKWDEVVATFPSSIHHGMYGFENVMTIETRELIVAEAKAEAADPVAYQAAKDARYAAWKAENDVIVSANLAAVKTRKNARRNAKNRARRARKNEAQSVAV